MHARAHARSPAQITHTHTPYARMPPHTHARTHTLPQAAARRIMARAEEDRATGASSGPPRGAATDKLSAVPNVEIAEVFATRASFVLACAFTYVRPFRHPNSRSHQGKWKYVQITISAEGKRKNIVRSFRGLKFHAQNYDQAAARLRPLGIRCSVVGGGRIELSHRDRNCKVYGYSKTFGRAAGCNEASANLIRGAYPDYSVTWSDGGY